MDVGQDLPDSARELELGIQDFFELGIYSLA